MSAHRNYDIIVSKTPEEDDYPPHVQAKLKAYKDAGLNYLIAQDSVMRRSIVFNAKKKAFPNKYKMRIENVFRLRDPKNNQEYIVYDTLERVLDDNNVDYRDNIVYGVQEFIKTEPKYDRDTGMLSDREKTVHTNVFTIEYTPKRLQSIFDSMHKDYEDHTVSMFIGEASKDAEKLYAGDRLKVTNRDHFINRTFDELLLMRLTVTNTPEEALAAAKTLREDKGLLSDLAYKDKILGAEARVSAIKKKSS